MSHFRPINRDVDFLLPPSVQDWLPEGHLAHRVVEVVDGLDRGGFGQDCDRCHVTTSFREILMGASRN